MTIRTAIVLWVHMALTKRPQLVARMSEVVAFGMKPYMRDYFSLVNENVDLSTRDGRMDYNNDWYHRIWRALERVRATMEPYPEEPGRVSAWANPSDGSRGRGPRRRPSP